jgi:hypothetical protein
MGQAQRLGQHHGIRGGPGLVQHGQDRRVLRIQGLEKRLSCAEQRQYHYGDDDV